MSNGTSAWLGFRPAPAKKSGKDTAYTARHGGQEAGTLKLIMVWKMGEFDLPRHLSKNNLHIE